MDRPQPAVADTARLAHGLQPGAVLAAQGPVGIPGIAGQSFLHRHPRWLFSIAHPASTQTEEKKGCVSFSGLAGQMAQAEGLAPSSRGFGDRCFALSYAYKKCPASQPGWGNLIHSGAVPKPRRPHAAKRNRNGQLRICPPQTQKPQGGFPFLTAFDDSIITWIFGFLMQIDLL